MGESRIIYAFLILTAFGLAFPKTGFAEISESIPNPKADSVYTFPFHMDNRLLVFEGEINGVPTKFAFDTGAGRGLADPSFKKDGRLSKNLGKMTIRDSNKTRKSVKTAKATALKIGGYEFEDVRTLLVDMPFLSCFDFYLLGADVIRQLNWKIDFDKQLVSVSTTPFPIETGGLSFPVTFKGNRPFVDISFSGRQFNEILVDFGYTETLNLEMKMDDKFDYFIQKEAKEEVFPYLGYSMGALSTSTDLNYDLILDTLQIGNGKLFDIPLEIEERTTSKIGLAFFSRLSSYSILNNSDSLFHLALRSGPPKALLRTYVSFTFQDGKIIVTGKPLDAGGPSDGIELGEEILEINGKRASDFSDLCAFLDWQLRMKAKDIFITKLDGTQLIFRALWLE